MLLRAIPQIPHNEIIQNGVDLIVGGNVFEFRENTIVLESGRVVESEVVVTVIGVNCETQLANDECLELGKTGGIKVDSMTMLSSILLGV